MMIEHAYGLTLTAGSASSSSRFSSVIAEKLRLVAASMTSMLLLSAAAVGCHIHPN